MNCSGCGKEIDTDIYGQHLINNTWYYLCLNEDDHNDCTSRVKQAMLRAIHLLREQNGITLFDHGIPMNPVINGLNPHLNDWVGSQQPPWESLL